MSKKHFVFENDILQVSLGKTIYIKNIIIFEA